MANQAPTTLPFTKAVVECMRKLCPEHLADRSWDNTGLLLESPANHQRPKKDIALLTIDITKAVAQEAVDKDASIIISYHPFIFKGLKSITLANTQQQSLLQLVQEGISVYSPHTALDSVRGGLNDWLADVVAKCSKLHGGFFIEANDYKRKAIIPNEEMTGSGQGRIIRFSSPRKLSDLLNWIKRDLNLSSLSVATPRGREVEEIQFSSVGICAGSGDSLLQGLDVDVLLTGEISHHTALAAIENGKVVITTFHSNSERGILPTVSLQLSGLLLEYRRQLPLTEQYKGDFQILISEMDHDPFRLS